LLIEVASSEPDQELREVAVESLAWLEELPEIGGPLTELLASDPSADVRAAIYRTLGSRAQNSMSPEALETLLPLVLSEEVPVARREAYRMAAIRLHHDLRARLSQVFDDSMVPWLKHDAEHGASPYARKTSLGALAIAGTRASEAALLALTQSNRSDIAAAAQQALKRRQRASG
jgi:hypothetical protein